MWFVTTGHNKTKFYSSNGLAIEVPKIEWTNEIKIKKIEYYSSKSFIKDSQQAISALFESGIKGYSTKLEAKEFAKTLSISTWKYLQLK